ncbi:MAG: hypothetical protein R3F39_09155 [Myxococcota bacterium]
MPTSDQPTSPETPHPRGFAPASRLRRALAAGLVALSAAALAPACSDDSSAGDASTLADATSDSASLDGASDTTVTAKPAPTCTPPQCWAIQTGPLSQGIAPDRLGGLTALVTATGDLIHVDATGTIDRTEPLGLGYDFKLSGTGDGGFLIVVPGSLGTLLGTPLNGNVVMAKVSADWKVKWTATATTLSLSQAHAIGSPADGGGVLLDKNVAGGGGKTSQVDRAVRYDADGNIVWERRLPDLATWSLADNGDLLATVGTIYYLETPESLFTAPEGSTLVGGAFRMAPNGTIRWSIPFGNADGAKLTHRPGPILGTPDGGAFVAPHWYRAGGQLGPVHTVYVGNEATLLPTYELGAAGSPIVRLDFTGLPTSIEWPWNHSPKPHAEGRPSVTSSVYSLAPAPDNGALVAGVVMVYLAEGPKLVAYDGGASKVAGLLLPHSGAYLARLGSDGKAEWAAEHWLADEFGYGTLATDGANLFFDAFGPDFASTPGGPGGNLLKWPTAPPQ